MTSVGKRKSLPHSGETHTHVYRFTTLNGSGMPESLFFLSQSSQCEKGVGLLQKGQRCGERGKSESGVAFWDMRKGV